MFTTRLPLPRLVCMIVLALTLLLSVPPGAISHAGPPISAYQIDTYLAGKNSPMNGLGWLFVSEGERHDVDPRLVVAIAGAETNFGTTGCGLAPAYNAWHWFPNSGGCSQNHYASYETLIPIVTQGLRRYHLDLGYTSVATIAPRYTGSASPTSWQQAVTTYVLEMGGDVNDLTFGGAVTSPTPSIGGAVQANLLTNPGFELGGLTEHRGWSFTPHNWACNQRIYDTSTWTPVQPHGGQRKLHVGPNNTYPNCASVFQDVVYRQSYNQQFTFAVWLASSAPQEVDVVLWALGTQTRGKTHATVGSQWQCVQTVLNSPGGSSTLRPEVYMYGFNNDLYVDDAMLVEGARDICPPSGGGTSIYSGTWYGTETTMEIVGDRSCWSRTTPGTYSATITPSYDGSSITFTSHDTGDSYTLPRVADMTYFVNVRTADGRTISIWIQFTSSTTYTAEFTTIANPSTCNSTVFTRDTGRAETAGGVTPVSSGTWYGRELAVDISGNCDWGRRTPISYTATIYPSGDFSRLTYRTVGEDNASYTLRRLYGATYGGTSTTADGRTVTISMTFDSPTTYTAEFTTISNPASCSGTFHTRDTGTYSGR